MGGNNIYKQFRNLFLSTLATLCIGIFPSSLSPSYTPSFHTHIQQQSTTQRQEEEKHITSYLNNSSSKYYIPSHGNDGKDIEALYDKVREFRQIKKRYPTYVNLFIRYAKVREDIHKIEKALHLHPKVLPALLYVESRYRQNLKSAAKAYGISQITEIAYRDVVDKYNDFKNNLKNVLDKESYEKVMRGEVLDWEDTDTLRFKQDVKFSKKRNEIIAKEIMPLFLSRTINLLKAYNLSSLPSWDEVKHNTTYNLILGALFYNLKYLYNINLQAISEGKDVDFVLRSYKHFIIHGDSLRFFDPFTIYMLYNSVPKFKRAIIKAKLPNCRLEYINTKKGIIMNETLIGLYNLKFALSLIDKFEELYKLHMDFMVYASNLLVPDEYKVQKAKETAENVMKLLAWMYVYYRNNLTAMRIAINKHTS